MAEVNLKYPLETTQEKMAQLAHDAAVQRANLRVKQTEREEEQRQAILSMATSFDRIATALEAMAGKGADNGET